MWRDFIEAATFLELLLIVEPRICRVQYKVILLYSALPIGVGISQGKQFIPGAAGGSHCDFLTEAG